MALLEKLNSVKDTIKLTVHGWMRETTKQLQFVSTIPPLIFALCILYLNEEERFAIIRKYIESSDDEKKIWKTFDDREFTNNYGQIVIPSLSNCLCRWNFMVHDVSLVSLFIGVSWKVVPEPSGPPQMDDSHYCIHNAGYKNMIEKRHFGAYCDEIHAGDKVTLILDLKRAQIRYIINDKDQGVAYQDILKGEDVNYRLNVCIRKKGVSISITNFERHYAK